MAAGTEVEVNATRTELLDRLRRANDALRRATRAVTWREGLQRAGKALVVLACAHLLYRAGLWMIGGPATTLTVVCALAAATVVVALATAGPAGAGGVVVEEECLVAGIDPELPGVAGARPEERGDEDEHRERMAGQAPGDAPEQLTHGASVSSPSRRPAPRRRAPFSAMP